MNYEKGREGTVSAMMRLICRVLTAVFLGVACIGCETNTNLSTTAHPALIVGRMVKNGAELGNAFPCVKPDQDIRNNEITTDRVTLDAGRQTVYVAYQGSGRVALFTVPAMSYAGPFPMEAMLQPDGSYEVRYELRGSRVAFAIADKRTGEVVGRSKEVALESKDAGPVDWSLYTPGPIYLKGR